MASACRPQHTSAPAGRRSPLPSANQAGELGGGGGARHRLGTELAQMPLEGLPPQDVCPLGPVTICVCLCVCVCACGRVCLGVCVCTSEGPNRAEAWEGGLACPQEPSPHS